MDISQQLFNKQSQRLWRLADESKQYDSSYSQHDDIKPNEVTSGSELQKKTQKVFSLS